MLDRVKGNSVIKRWLLGVAAVLVLGALGGCSGGSDGGGDSAGNQWDEMQWDEGEWQ
jgi:hypothetical protein